MINGALNKPHGEHLLVQHHIVVYQRWGVSNLICHEGRKYTVGICSQCLYIWGRHQTVVGRSFPQSFPLANIYNYQRNARVIQPSLFDRIGFVPPNSLKQRAIISKVISTSRVAFLTILISLRPAVRFIRAS
jgi:hypothetical protein